MLELSVFPQIAVEQEGEDLFQKISVPPHFSHEVQNDLNIRFLMS
jgi:hypothetical protein